MKYLILFIFLFSTAAQAQMMSSDNGIRKPQMMTVAQNNAMEEPEDPDFDSIPLPMDEPVMPDMVSQPSDDIDLPIVPTQPLDPFSAAPTPPVVQQQKKQVLKKIPNMKIQRSIADDRIDDFYVQEMIKNNFNFSKPVE